MSPTPRLLGSLLVAALTPCLGAQRAAAQDSADEAEAARMPERYLATVSAGIPLRLTQDEDFGQDTFAPLFSDALLGYVFAGERGFRHGLGVGMSLNLMRDGGYSEPVYVAEQFSVMPAYLLYADFGHDTFALAHLGLPVVLTGIQTLGVELAATLGYRLLARFGLFAELSFDAFFGTASSFNPTLALEGGIFFDYEVLP
jgi:hypothetical protein